MGCNAGLDSPGTQSDQGQSEKQADPGLVHGQGQMAGAVDQRQKDDGPVLAQKRIGKNGPDDGQKIGRSGEQVKVGSGVLFGKRVQYAIPVHQILSHENDQYCANPVEAEPLGYIIDDDIGNPARHPVRWHWCCTVAWH